MSENLHRPNETSVNVLFISPDESAAGELKGALAGSRWNLLHAATCAHGADLLRECPVPILIRDHDCCNLGCPHAVKCARLSSYPAVLLISVRSRDFRTWEEVLDSGGLDILPKPFSPPVVMKYLEFAHKHWLAGALRRDWDHFDYPE